AVALGGRLVINVGTGLSVGDTYTIVNNDGSDAVTGAFANGATIRAANNALYTFTVNTASGSGNDVVLTLASIDAAPALDVTGGQVVYNTPNGVNSDLTVSLVG